MLIQSTKCWTGIIMMIVHFTVSTTSPSFLLYCCCHATTTTTTWNQRILTKKQLSTASVIRSIIVPMTQGKTENIMEPALPIENIVESQQRLLLPTEQTATTKMVVEYDNNDHHQHDSKITRNELAIMGTLVVVVALLAMPLVTGGILPSPASLVAEDVVVSIMSHAKFIRNWILQHMGVVTTTLEKMIWMEVWRNVWTRVGEVITTKKQQQHINNESSSVWWWSHSWYTYCHEIIVRGTEKMVKKSIEQKVQQGIGTRLGAIFDSFFSSQWDINPTAIVTMFVFGAGADTSSRKSVLLTTITSKRPSA